MQGTDGTARLRARGGLGGYRAGGEDCPRPRGALQARGGSAAPVGRRGVIRASPVQFRGERGRKRQLLCGDVGRVLGDDVDG